MTHLKNTPHFCTPEKKQPRVAIILGYRWRLKMDIQPDEGREWEGLSKRTPE